MKVFISHSLPRSLDLARALEEFIRKVVPGTDPWVSDTGIEKGARFMHEIRENLNEAAAGIVCLTHENLSERWILYEAGALSTKLTDRVWTFLLDVEHSAVAPPLSSFLHTTAEKEDVRNLIRSIHKTLVATKERTCEEKDLNDYFEAFWSKLLEPKIAALRSQGEVPRAAQDPNNEILDLVRQIAEYQAQTSWREEKILAMMHQVYGATVGGTSPSLEGLKEALRQQQRIAASITWQPQYTKPPLVLRQATNPSITVVDPPTPPES